MTSINHPSIKSITIYRVYHGKGILPLRRFVVVGHVSRERAISTTKPFKPGTTTYNGQKINCFSPSKDRGGKQGPLSLWRHIAFKISDRGSWHLSSTVGNVGLLWLTGAYFDAVEVPR